MTLASDMRDRTQAAIDRANTDADNMFDEVIEEIGAEADNGKARGL